jgi:hypothetical protein
MKSKYILGLVLCVIAAACIIYVPRPYEGDSSYVYDDSRAGRVDDIYDEYGLDLFYDSLDPYGYWVRRSNYGYVWVPHDTGYGWRPYTHGRWLWTDHGWNWVSAYDWGWAPFHYGRWGWDEVMGWYWVPGTEWAPSWVSWRWGGNHIGWAPLPPDVRFDPRFGINTLPFALREQTWVFVEYRYFYDTRLTRFVLPHERNRTFISASQLRTKIQVDGDRIVNWGIDVDDVSNRMGQGITEYQLRNTRYAGPPDVRTGELYAYRPRMKEEQSSAPRRVVRPEEVQQKVSESRLSRQRRVSTQPLDQQIQQRQRQEVQNLEESQRKELNRLRQNAEEAKRKAESTAARQKVEKEYQEKSARARSQHDKEKTKIKERHTTERTKVTKKTVTKKKKK